jgi:hypothetical protein
VAGFASTAEELVELRSAFLASSALAREVKSNASQEAESPNPAEFLRAFF